MTGQEQASWLGLPRRAVLTSSAVHLWAARLGDFANRTSDLVALLPADERTRAARYRIAEPRQRFVIGRWLLRALLGAYLDQEASGIRLEPGLHGKPHLADTRGSDLRFSVAHSGALVIVAIAVGREVGVDVECIEPDITWTAVMRRLYSDVELRWVDTDPTMSVSEAVLSLWTCKEAFGKALGIGLSPPILALDEVLNADGGLPLKWTHRPEGHERDAARTWAVCRLTAFEGYAGALVVELPTGNASPVDLRHYSLEAPDGRP